MSFVTFSYKNGTRESMSFSNQRAREIERENQILLSKIMRNGPSGDGFSSPGSSAGKVRASLLTAGQVDNFLLFTPVAAFHCQVSS